jgi:3-phosphoshikimate 1-carboxyvinyltransferase
MIEALSESKDFSITNLSEAKDTQVLKNILNQDKEEVMINVGHAGTAMRFLAAYYATKSNINTTLTGSKRMESRPIELLVSALLKLGANIQYLEKEGYPPIHILGRQLEGGELEINSSVSSQYVSALLMIAPTLSKGLLLKLKGKVVSRPYIDMTLDLMSYFGVEVASKNNSEYKILPQHYVLKSVTIEADWSAASYWFEVAALSSSCNIQLKGLRKSSRQGDQKVMSFYRELGVVSNWVGNTLVLTKQSSYTLDRNKSYQFDLEETPDLAQTLICTCAGLGLEATFVGLSTLKIKETDRLKALKTELNKFAVDLEVKSASEAYLAKGQLMVSPDSNIETYEDHRMAMSFAPLALVVGKLTISNSEVVRKSYPSFWNDLGSVFEIEI